MPAPANNFKKITGRLLTDRLNELAAEVFTVGTEKNILTRAEYLAELVWNHATGFTQTTTIMVEGKEQEHTVALPPQRWAIELLFNRIEGRVGQAAPDGSTRPSAGQKIRDASISKINNMS